MNEATVLLSTGEPRSAGYELSRWLSYSTAVALHVAIFAVGQPLLKESARAGAALGGGGGPVTVSLVASAPQSISAPPPPEQAAQQKSAEPLPEEVKQPEEKVIVQSEFVKPKPLPEKKKITKLPKSSTEKQHKPTIPVNSQIPLSSTAPTQTMPTQPVAPQGGEPSPSNEQPSGSAGVTRGLPDYLSNPAPAYPVLSRRMKEEGVVLLEVRLSDSGLVERVSLKKSSSFERLDEAALKAVRQWRFKPSKMGGVAIADTVEVPIRFALDHK